MRYALETVTASTQVCVTRAELKTWLRLNEDSTEEDTALDAVALAAQAHLEDVTGRSFFKQTFRVTYDQAEVPTGTTYALPLPKSPLVDSTLFSVTSYDDDNTASVWSTSEYRIDDVSEPGRLVADESYTWPDDLRQHECLLVTFQAGYSTATSGIPDRLALAVKTYAAYLYEHRGDEAPIALDPSGVPQAVAVLIGDYRLPEVG